MGKKFGYGRVSTADQDLTIQAEALERAGCVASFLEKRSGTTTEGREELRRVLSILGEGDELVVLRLDRLARSIGDLVGIVAEIEKKGAHLRCLEQPVETGTAAGKAFLGMLGVFAEFETNLRKERQAEGIAKAKAEGKYKGRPKLGVAEEVARLHAEGVGPSAISKTLGIAPATVFRRLAEIRGAEKVEG
jgi:DNA invertase Pin-like site-specific DNA recombinase